MSVTKEKFGKTSAGEDIYIYTICSPSGIKAEILNLGCTVRSLVVSKNDKEYDVVLGRETAEDYLHNKGYLGSTVGRFANRIKNATFDIGGKKFVCKPNRSGHLLHSGANNFGTMVWEENVIGDDYVSLKIVSPDGENGFPGDLTVITTFELKNKALKIRYEAMSNKDTIVNLTNHSYFNLNGHDSGSVCNHTLKINADFYTPMDSELLPTGEILSVKGTPLDFSDRKPIGKDLGTMKDMGLDGYDHNFVTRGNGMREIAYLTGDKSGITMTTTTNKPGVQLFTGQFFDGSIEFKHGARYDRYQGVCLETQFFPNCTEFSHFPSAVLKCEDKYDYITIYSFE